MYISLNTLFMVQYSRLDPSCPYFEEMASCFDKGTMEIAHWRKVGNNFWSLILNHLPCTTASIVLGDLSFLQNKRKEKSIKNYLMKELWIQLTKKYFYKIYFHSKHKVLKQESHICQICSLITVPLYNLLIYLVLFMINYSR